MVKVKIRPPQPPEWAKKRANNLHTDYWQFAKKFENLKLSGKIRKNGFVKYGPNHIFTNSSSGNFDFKPLWRTEKYVKPEISLLSENFCAYCQSSVTSNQHGEIEHFQPKSLFPMLAYDWDNFFLGCTLCNHTKDNNWHFSGYIRPDDNNLEEYFEFCNCGAINAREKGKSCGCSIPITPGKGKRPSAAKQMIEDFGLNRSALKTLRNQVIKKAVNCLKRILNHNFDIATKREFASDQLVPTFYPFSEAINQNIRRAWLQALPNEKPL